MVDTEKPFNIHDYIEIGLRRKWYTILPIIASVLISFAVYKHLPKIYSATTLILVQPQRIPESYVRPTITAPVTDRLNTISQEILSRTRLEKVIQEFNLYSGIRDKIPMEEIVEEMRKVIGIKVHGQGTSNTFSVSFQGEDPKTVMMVTNKLASLFIEENLKVRELQAEGTSEFLSKELHAKEEQLKINEHNILNFKQKHMGELPQQLDANLRILDSLKQQFKTVNDNRRAAEDRNIMLKNQIDQMKAMQQSLKEQIQIIVPRESRSDQSARPTEEKVNERIPEDPLITQINILRRELSNAQSKYTERHPDVIDLKRKITSLEPKVKTLLEKQQEIKEARLPAPGDVIIEDKLPVSRPDSASEKLLIQYGEQYKAALLEVKRLKEEEKYLREQTTLYQKRIEDTPKREQELILVTRDYDLLKANYQALLDKKISAQMAESLERKQQGEQFKILDLARLPEKPIRPDAAKIFLIGTFMGLLSGFGLVCLRESMDQSFHNVAGLEDYLKLSVLAEIPNMHGEKTLSRRG